MKRRMITAQDVDRIVELHAQGQSTRQIGREFSIHQSTVATHLRSRGITRETFSSVRWEEIRRIVKNKGYQTTISLSPEEKKVLQVALQYRSGMSLREISKSKITGFNTSLTWMNILGISRPRTGKTINWYKVDLLWKKQQYDEPLPVEKSPHRMHPMQDIVEVAKRYVRGYTYAQITQEVHVEQKNAADWMKKLGLPLRNKKRNR